MKKIIILLSVILLTACGGSSSSSGNSGENSKQPEVKYEKLYADFDHGAGKLIIDFPSASTKSATYYSDNEIPLTGLVEYNGTALKLTGYYYQDNFTISGATTNIVCQVEGTTKNFTVTIKEKGSDWVLNRYTANKIETALDILEPQIQQETGLPKSWLGKWKIAQDEILLAPFSIMDPNDSDGPFSIISVEYIDENIINIVALNAPELEPDEFLPIDEYGNVLTFIRYKATRTDDKIKFVFTGLSYLIDSNFKTYGESFSITIEK